MPKNMMTPVHKVDEEVYRLFDPAELKQSLQQRSGNAISLVKKAVGAINDGLQEYYSVGGDASDIVYGRSLLTDQLLQCLHQHFFSALEQDIALVL